ncbi:hypothetical protein TUM4438_39280 [Shewanella sairae]|uniref:Uncharacterized protein n=1 Tax=Shewanella sairae TaxID=190310 RepID=A0ABQ4PQ12_9GAMM|nr:hypothetical protein TUM4438_39280 [Shewanella sairae]
MIASGLVPNTSKIFTFLPLWIADSHSSKWLPDSRYKPILSRSVPALEVLLCFILFGLEAIL